MLSKFIFLLFSLLFEIGFFLILFFNKKNTNNFLDNPVSTNFVLPPSLDIACRVAEIYQNGQIMHKRVTVKATGCGFDSHTRKWNIYYFHLFVLVSRQSAALHSTIQNAMPPEFSGQWEKECRNTPFPESLLLPISCAGNSVNLKK